MKPLLEIKNLKVQCKSDRGFYHALNGVNLSVFPGKVTAIVGESGSGKSLTALSILNLLPPHSVKITEGSIEYLGENLFLKSEREMGQVRGKEISMVFQNPMSSLNPTLTIGHQMMEGLRHHYGLSRAQGKKEVLHILKAVEIPDPEKRFSQYPHQLSGGMQQRVMIGMAIVCKPKLLIADEPTTALDVTIQAQILALIKTIQKETGIAILVITHDLGIVAKVCDYVGVMHNGSIIEYGEVSQIFENPQHPHTVRLLESKRKMVSFL